MESNEQNDKKLMDLYLYEQKVAFLLNNNDFWNFSNKFYSMRSRSWSGNYIYHNVNQAHNNVLDFLDKEIKNINKTITMFDKKEVSEEFQEILDSTIRFEVEIRRRTLKSLQSFKLVKLAINNKNFDKESYKTIEKELNTSIDSLKEALYINEKLQDVNKKIAEKYNEFEDKSINDYLMTKIGKATEKVTLSIKARMKK